MDWDGWNGVSSGGTRYRAPYNACDEGDFLKLKQSDQAYNSTSVFLNVYFKTLKYVKICFLVCPNIMENELSLI